MMLGMINAAAQQVNTALVMFEHGFTAVTNRNALRRRIGGGIIVIEDQESVSAWADQTFGPASSNARVAAVLSRLGPGWAAISAKRSAQDGDQSHAAVKSHARRRLRLPRPRQDSALR
jgi:hypothetical protein